MNKYYKLTITGEHEQLDVNTSNMEYMQFYRAV